MSDQSYRNCTAPYDEQWAEVELFRWQYGELPRASDDRKLDIMKGLGMLGEALGTPGTPVDLANASQAIMRAAHEIYRLQAENERLRKIEKRAIAWAKYPCEETEEDLLDLVEDSKEQES